MVNLDNNWVVDYISMKFPKKTITQVIDKGMWIRKIFRVIFDDNTSIILKIDQGDEGEGTSEKEAYIAQLFSGNGIPAPKTLILDKSKEHCDFSLIVQEYVGGIKLGTVLEQVGVGEQLEVWKNLGRFFRQLHTIKGEQSGWLYGWGEQLPYPPNQYMYQNVVVQNGLEAVKRGYLSSQLQNQIQNLWRENLDFLNDHIPTLLSGGPFHWTIYLDPDPKWHVKKLTDLHDVLYWDPAVDLAQLWIPPFLSRKKNWWQAFLEEYGTEPDLKRLALYKLMQIIDALIGKYYEPSSPSNDLWRKETITEVEPLLELARSN